MLNSLRHDLKTLVNINSHTLNPEGVRAVGESLRPRFEALGFQATWHKNTDPDFGDHLFLTLPGEGSHILLLGHLDTVYPISSHFQRYEEKDGQATGPGVYDMKGGLLVILYALEALHAEGKLAGKHITVALLGDEEQTSQPWEVSRQALLKAAQSADVAIGFEFARADNVAVVERRGTTNWMLEVHAQGGHSSRVGQAECGSGAIYHAARLLQCMHEEMTKHLGMTLNPGRIAGGSMVKEQGAQAEVSGPSNIIATHAIVHGDMRFTHMQQFDDVVHSMQHHAKDPHDPHVQVTLTFSSPKPAMERTPGNDALLKRVSDISVSLGREPVHAVDRMIAGASDMNMVSPYVPACIDSLGVLGGGAHSEHEWIDIASFPFVVERVKRLLVEI
ncbi:MAG: M20/M25/M40 family metallo-hydrolase [Gammaproteobacteria bacterium]